MVYFISDLHLGHSNCLAYDNRPFKTVEDQDKFIIEEWNKIVDPKDRVWILGDISWYSPQKTDEIYSQLNGTKSLCIGNHDKSLLKSKKVQNLLPVSGFFHVPELEAQLFSGISSKSDISTVKGTLYILCGIFDQTAEYRQRANSGEDSLLYTILEYIEKNYSGECLLKNVIDSIKYDYAYISKFFKKNIGISFNEYVNRRRVSEACYLLKTTDKSVLEIGMECGYDSLRSFNRNFRLYLNMSPREFQKNTALSLSGI